MCDTNVTLGYLRGSLANMLFYLPNGPITKTEPKQPKYY